MQATPEVEPAEDVRPAQKNKHTDVRLQAADVVQVCSAMHSAPAPHGVQVAPAPPADQVPAGHSAHGEPPQPGTHAAGMITRQGRGT